MIVLQGSITGMESFGTSFELASLHFIAASRISFLLESGFDRSVSNEALLVIPCQSYWGQHPIGQEQSDQTGAKQ